MRSRCSRRTRTGSISIDGSDEPGALEEGVQGLVGEVVTGELVWTATQDDDDIVARFQGRVQIANRFAHQALAAIALVRFADFFASDDRIAVGNRGIGMRKNANDNRALGKCLATGPSMPDLPVVTKAEGAIYERSEKLGSSS